MKRNWLFILVFTLFVLSCKKEILNVDKTEMSIEYEVDIFNDSIYDVTEFKITSTNDSILNDGRIKIQDENNVVFFDDEWRNLINNSFALPERKIYDISFVLYRNINEQIQIDLEKTHSIDNRKKPVKFQLLSASIENSILENQDVGGLNTFVSSSYSVLVNARLSNAYDDSESMPSNSNSFSYDYYYKFHQPKKINFTFPDLYFDTRKIFDNERKWMHYEISFNYPLQYGSTFVQYRSISFFIDVLSFVNADDIEPNIEYEIENDISATSGGGTSVYKGIIKIKWIYEN
ncbi:MAG: hypothetical protein ACWA41_04220 [Putridiphycobacter sp.]